MPDMHGIDVLKFVRQQPSLQRLPVVVLTTRGDDSSRIAAQQAGATAYLTKPFIPGTLWPKPSADCWWEPPTRWSRGDHRFELDGFLDDYFAECDEHLSDARRHLLSLEAALGSPGAERSAVEDLFRIFHSIKGISGMVELREAEQLAHEMESYLRALRQRELLLTAEGVDALIDGAQRLEQVVAARSRDAAIPPIADLHRVSPHSCLPLASPGQRRPAGTHRCPLLSTAARRSASASVPSRERADQSIGVDLIRRRIAEHGTILETIPHVGEDGSIEFVFVVTTTDVVGLESLRQLHATVDRIGEAPPAAVLDSPPNDAPAATQVERAASSHYVRVELERLDQFMRGVGDLVMSRARLSDSLARAGSPGAGRNGGRSRRTRRPSTGSCAHCARGSCACGSCRSARSSTACRWSCAISRAPLAAASISSSRTGTEIDKYLIERMMDPVLHLVRNAIAHGIETPEVRVAAEDAARHHSAECGDGRRPCHDRDCGRWRGHRCRARAPDGAGRPACPCRQDCRRAPPCWRSSARRACPPVPSPTGRRDAESAWRSSRPRWSSSPDRCRS